MVNFRRIMIDRKNPSISINSGRFAEANHLSQKIGCREALSHPWINGWTTAINACYASVLSTLDPETFPGVILSYQELVSDSVSLAWNIRGKKTKKKLYANNNDRRSEYVDVMHFQLHILNDNRIKSIWKNIPAITNHKVIPFHRLHIWKIINI